MDSTPLYNVAIIGSGPAGYTAAIYTSRASLKPILIEGTSQGGALMNTTDVENFPGFDDGIQGPDLMRKMRNQAEKFGTTFVDDDATSIDLAGEIKTITTSSQKIRTKSIILCMGSEAKYLGIPGEKKLLGHGVSACATCDGFFFKNHHLAVIGGGDSAMEEAIFLTKFAASVTVIHRREEFKASSVMLDRARTNPKITFLTSAVPTKIVGDTKVTGIEVQMINSQTLQHLPVTGVFVAIGHTPRSELVHDTIKTDDAGYVIVQGRTTATNVPGVFAAGDLIDSHYQQAVTAAGSGCMAALDSEKYLSHLEATL